MRQHLVGSRARHVRTLMYELVKACMQARRRQLRQGAGQQQLAEAELDQGLSALPEAELQRAWMLAAWMPAARGARSGPCTRFVIVLVVVLIYD